jgi:hypothetical protein
MAVKEIDDMDQSATCPASGNVGHIPLIVATRRAPSPNQMIVKDGIISSKHIRHNPAITQCHHTISILNLVRNQIPDSSVPHILKLDSFNPMNSPYINKDNSRDYLILKALYDKKDVCIDSYFKITLHIIFI